MNGEIPKKQWRDFCDQLSQEKYNWKILVQVLSNEIGVQILNKSLPFAGLTFEEKNEQQLIELTVGNSLENHQAHTIFDPEKLIFWSAPNSMQSTLDIVDKSGTTTLITFTKPETVEINGRENYPIQTVSNSENASFLRGSNRATTMAQTLLTFTPPQSRLIKRFG